MSGETNQPSIREQRVNEAIAAYLEAVDAGEAPDPSEFVAQHGDIATELESFFTNRDEFERMAEPLQPADNAAPSPQGDDPTLPPAGEPTEAPTLAPTETPGAAIGTMVRYFGDYELLDEIARGGMGVVYKARQVSLNRIVALKMILAGQLAGEEDVQRFHAEAEAAANLDHPGIVPIFEVGEHEGQHYFSMGFVEGNSLSAKVADGPLPPKKAAEYTKKVAEAVAYAHEHGVIHRDLKPANVLLDANDQPKVTDFGLAKKVEGDEGLTATGQILGTPGYMPPEQASGKIDEVTETADIYSLGAILYNLLTARPPFQADNPLDTLMQVLEQEPVSPGQLNRNVPQDLETICLKCLEKDRQRRYASVPELGEELQRFLSGEPIHARPISPTARAWRWCKRKPFLAGFWAIATMLLLTLSIGGPWLAILQTRYAEQQTAFAKKQLKLRREARHNLYGAHLQLMQNAWDEAKVTRLVALLELHLPAKDEPDLRGFEWYYFQRLCSSHLLELEGHESIVTSVAFSPDATRIVSGSKDKTLKLWDAMTGQELRTLEGHVGGVSSVAFSPDGQRIVSGSHDQTLKVWHAETGQDILTLKGHENMVNTVAFSPDGKRIASGSNDRTVKVWDLEAGNETLSLNGHSRPVQSVSFSPDGNRIVSSDGGIKLWDARTGQETDAISSVRISPGDRGVVFSPDGKQIASAEYMSIYVRNADTKQETRTTRTRTGRSVKHTGNPTTVAFSPDGARIVAGCSDNTIVMWHVATGKKRILKGHDFRVTSVAFGPKGRRFASGSCDKTVKLWDADVSQGPIAFSVRSEERAVIAFAGDGTQVFSGLGSVTFSPDGARLALGVGERKRGQVKVLDAESGQEIYALKGHEGLVSSVAFRPDGERIASGSHDTTILIWDAATREAIHALRGHTSVVSSVAFSRDGKRVVSGSFDKTIRVWQADTGEEKLKLEGHIGSVHGVAFSPDGQRIVSGGKDGSVMIWDSDTGREIRTMKGHGLPVTTVALSPDGKKVVSGSVDTTVKVWEVSTGRLTHTLRGHGSPVTSVTFNLDGRRIASGSLDQSVKLWDAETGQEVLGLKGDEGRTGGVTRVGFSPNGKRIVAAANLTVWVWDARPAKYSSQ